MSTHLNLPGSDVPAIDETRMMKEFGGAPEILLELRDLFLEHAPSLYEGIRQSTEDGDVQSVIEKAHSLKGACATYGAERLTLICKEIEMAARNADLETVRAYDDHLTREYEAVLEAVGQLSIG